MSIFPFSTDRGCSSVCVCVCWPVHWSRISISCPIYFSFNYAGSMSKVFYEWISEIFCSQSWIQKFAISIEMSSGWHFLVELPLLKHTCNQQGNCPRVRQASAVSAQHPTMNPQQAPAIPRYPVRWEAGGVCALQQGVTHFITRFFQCCCRIQAQRTWVLHLTQLPASCLLPAHWMCLETACLQGQGTSFQPSLSWEPLHPNQITHRCC